MRPVILRVAFAASCVVLVGCGASGALPPTVTLPPVSTRSVPIATPTAAATSLPPTPFIPPATATPDFRPATTPFPGVTLTARSTPATVGRMYPFELYTHCGVDFAVDFNGSFWEAAIPGYPGYGAAPTPIDNPFQRGTMTLLDPDNAFFVYPNGRIPFRRLGATKVVPGLCA